jgi:two-component system C4-dicarboxylate transport sensor histidine kinase DctB
LSFRPYVVDAIKLGRGRFYGVGITSRKPGYYLSYALRRRRAPARRGCGEGRHRRRRTRMAQAARRRTADRRARRGDPVDPRRPEVPPLAPLQAAQRADVQHSRPYGDAGLQPLDWSAQEPWPPMLNSSR